jgi:hypothetical protein
MAITLSGDSPNLTSATLTTPTLTSPTISGTPVMGASVITSGIAVASTSGTSIDFTGIPSWAKKITVMFSGVSTSGTAQVLVQIGTSGGVVATGYLGTACLNVTSATTNTNSTGFRIEPSDASVTSSSVRHGIATITNITGNTWCFTSAHGHSNTSCSTYAGGSLALGGVLDRVRITTTNGTDTFDAGSINILYE